jgi:trehalose 6-phosphate synthase/phosphatase
MIAMPGRQRLVLVSNRLPVKVEWNDGDLNLNATAGGLVTGLSSFLASLDQSSLAIKEHLWVGWPGVSVDTARQRRVADALLVNHQAYPVFLSPEEMDQFYLGFCNNTIWPLFHSFPSFTAYDESLWQTYKRVNERFCDALLEVVRPDDVVWVHDYHLMVLPQLLKQRMPSLRIGFFLHIPFPSYEIFRLLPAIWRKDILNGLLGADLIGFHTYDYTQYFLQSVLRILGNGHNIGQILLPERSVKADTFPMGIDYEKFAGAAAAPDVLAEIDRVRSSLGDVRIVLSVDRLDYTKGILNRLEGFDQFLDQHGRWHGKIVLALVVVPSREGVGQYDQMKRQLEELVGRINGKHGSLGWTPIMYQYRNLPFVQLVALYAMSDVALVTPLRDGMNLVAKEYIAARRSGNGVLILSEMAGAAKELGEAVLINPNHCGEIASAIAQALDIPQDEQVRRMRVMQARLELSTVHRWASDFVHETIASAVVRNKMETERLEGKIATMLVKAYQRSHHRLFLLDYDGTLVPFVKEHAKALPGGKVLSLLARLAGDPANRVVIISGRDRHTLEQWFGNLPLQLVAEHGFFRKAPGEDWRTTKALPGGWKQRLQPILNLFADRLPGASVEEKEYSLVWHYRAADPEQGEPVAHELVDNLNALTGNVDIQIMQANKAVEIRVAGINKGTTAREIIAAGEYDFILAIGDDRTDEDMFAVLPEDGYSIKVGAARSLASYNCAEVDDVLHLLTAMAGHLRLHERPRTGLSAALQRLARFTDRLAAGKRSS